MSSKGKTIQKYCRIFNWIEDYDPDFATVMRLLCLDRITDTNQGITGITFLMPDKESEYRTKIIDAAYSDTPENAVKMIISLVIPKAIPNIKAFNNDIDIGNKSKIKFPDIDNSKSNKEQISFVTKKGTLVIESVGAKKSDLNFAPISEKKLFIYMIRMGETPNELNYGKDLPPYTIAFENKKPGRKKKGAMYGGDDENDIINRLCTKPRALFAQTIEGQARSSIESFDSSNNRYAYATVLLLGKLLKDNYCKQYFIKIRSIVDPDPIITFYLILEPYKLEGEYLIPSDVYDKKLFNHILSGSEKIDDIGAAYKKLLNIRINDSSLVFKSTKQIIETINGIRRHLLHNIEPRTLGDELLKVYTNLEENNHINPVGGGKSSTEPLTDIFPLILSNHYKNNPNKRLWQDEYRFIIGECLRNITSEPSPSDRMGTFNMLCNTLKTELRGDNYGEELCIMNFKDYALTTCIRDRVKIMQYFVNSPDFLFVGCSMELVCSINSPVSDMQGTDRITNAINYLTSDASRNNLTVSSDIKIFDDECENDISL